MGGNDAATAAELVPSYVCVVYIWYHTLYCGIFYLVGYFFYHHRGDRNWTAERLFGWLYLFCYQLYTLLGSSRERRVVLYTYILCTSYTKYMFFIDCGAHGILTHLLLHLQYCFKQNHNIHPDVPNRYGNRGRVVPVVHAT